MPSGDQEGDRSATPVLRVRFKTGPCSAGTLKSSPLASITARLPEGEIQPAWTLPATFSTRGFRLARSVTTLTSTSRIASFSRLIR